MKVVQDGTSTRVYVRQSWLNDALMCPERARLSELHPEMRRENDSALMGTAVHSAIEKVLNNQLDARDIGASAVASFDQLIVDLELQGKEVNVTNTDPSKWATHISSMAEAWARDIYPYVPQDGQTEYKFEAFIARVANARFEYELWFEGTMDYVHSSGIWDWKTAARKYSEYEKQAQNIQSAVYATAATHLGLTEYTVNFNFGVMIRNASSTGQVVNVTRTKQHEDWIVDQTSSVVNAVMALQGLPQERWIMNDQHHLCSERWCPVWSKCKGYYVGGQSLHAEEA